MIEGETYQWPNSSFPTKLRPHMIVTPRAHVHNRSDSSFSGLGKLSGIVVVLGNIKDT